MRSGYRQTSSFSIPLADTVDQQGRAHPGLSYSNAVGGAGYEAASNGGGMNPTPASGASPYASASSNGGPANGGSAYSSSRCGALVGVLLCAPWMSLGLRSVWYAGISWEVLRSVCTQQSRWTQRSCPWTPDPQQSRCAQQRRAL